MLVRAITTSHNRSHSSKLVYIILSSCSYTYFIQNLPPALTSNLSGLGGRNRLPQHGVQLHDLLVLDAADVRGVGVGACARDVTQLAAQRGAAARAPALNGRACRSEFDGCLLLLVLLAFEMLFVGLRGRGGVSGGLSAC